MSLSYPVLNDIILEEIIELKKTICSLQNKPSNRTDTVCVDSCDEVMVNENCQKITKLTKMFVDFKLDNSLLNDKLDKILANFSENSCENKLVQLENNIQLINTKLRGLVTDFSNKETSRVKVDALNNYSPNSEIDKINTELSKLYSYHTKLTNRLTILETKNVDTRTMASRIIGSINMTPRNTVTRNYSNNSVYRSIDTMNNNPTNCNSDTPDNGDWTEVTHKSKKKKPY